MRKKENKGYNWKFCSIGGVTRVNITSGEDIAHLGELDQKLWTVLSCPIKGLEFSEETLSLIDTDNDGAIRVNEIVAAAKWLTSVLKDPDLLIKQDSTIQLSAFNTENADGQKLYNSAKQILANLGLQKDNISVAETSDSVAIFANTQFNGDGVVTPASADDEEIKGLISNMVSTVGSVADRSGVQGVNAELVDKFYGACNDYAAWMDNAEQNKAAIFPYGDNTAAAYDACMAIKNKIADYFMRCKLVQFNADSNSALDVSVGKIEAISGNDLTQCDAEIATYPLARVGTTPELPLDADVINPAWKSVFEKVKSLVFDVKFGDRKSITEADWNSVLASFGDFVAWNASKKGGDVESLGLDAVKEIIAKNRKDDVVALIEKDKEYTAEAEGIDAVHKFALLFRDFYGLLKNYVAMTDFYQSYKGDVKAVFQAGRLYIDQRSCDLCIKVSDMGKHGDIAGLSGMYIIYCNCTSKVKGQKMTIAAVLTNGDVDDLRVGKNAVFYDRNGLDWEATITKIIENPVSIRQAFWSPYKKLGRWISEKISKSAEEKDAAATQNLISSADKTAADPAGEKKVPFDIAKFAGIFAAIGMAVGFIASAIVSLAHGIMAQWYNLPLLILAIIILISGPSMFIAWLKLRKRNLGPVLNANGWAINSKILVNTRFGATLTQLAKYPKVALDDPFVKKTPAWKKWLWGIIIALVAAFCVLYFTNSLKDYGLAFKKDAPTEQVVEAPENN